MKYGPQFPIYIPTKGRHDSRLTIKALQRMGVPFHAIVEASQYSDYAAVVPVENLLVLDPAYQRDYETCDQLGDQKSKGPGPARNFAWDHALAAGHPWHWVMDDNIRWWCRLNQNLKVKVEDGVFFRVMEDFCLRYENVAMAGPNYEMFAPRKQAHPPFVLNTRIYSCNLIRNDVPLRWRGRYNEDTILSLDMLKAGWCTVQFNAFLQHKVRTQTLPGGNTAEFYHAEGSVEAGKPYAAGGTRAKSKMLADVHPDCARVAWKYQRWHHEVDYSRFKSSPLIRKCDAPPPAGVDEYGMRLVRIT